MDYKILTMRYFLITILLILPISLFSQTEAPQPELRNFSLGIVPQYAIINGIRFDMDFKLKNKPNQSIVVAPQLYISTREKLFWNYNSMMGVGLELQHKIYLNKEYQSEGIYFAYGPTFNMSSVKDDGLVVQEFIDNGGNYIGLVNEEISTNIYKLGGNFILGVQLVVSDYLYIDPYVGIGIRFSFDNKTSGLHTYYDDWWADMGYSGTLMVGGIRIGVFL